MLGNQHGDVLVELGASKEPVIASGKYRVRTTRIERTVKGEHWFVSTTSARGPEIEIPAGKKVQLNVDDRVFFKASAQTRGQSLRLSFSISDADRRGTSIYHNYKRVAVQYEVQDERGKTIKKGLMKYG